MKGGRILVGLLTVLSLVVLTAAPVMATAVGPYDITFVTMRYDYPNPGYSTWYYTATSPLDENAISHLDIEIGACCDVVDAGVWTDYTTLTSWWNLGDEYIEVVEDPTTGVFGVKFNLGFDSGETRNYYFTVKGNHAVQADGVTIAIKTGGGGSGLLMQGTGMLASVLGVVARGLNLAPMEFTTYYASIYGPALDCEPITAVTLKTFSATSAGGSFGPALLLPGALLGMAVVAAGGAVLASRRRRVEA